MFFWLMLASLMGVIIFGNLQDKMKDRNDFVAPVYEAVALSVFRQHSYAEKGYLDAIRLNPDGAEEYINKFAGGVVPLITVEGGPSNGCPSSVCSGSDANDNLIYNHIRGFFPATYSFQNNTRSYLFCVQRNQELPNKKCNEGDPIKYIVTVRQLPNRFDDASKMTILKAIANATGHSRNVGLLERASSALPDKTPLQPGGAKYFIRASGVAAASSPYIPNFVICNFPLKNDESKVWGEMKATVGSPNVLRDKDSSDQKAAKSFIVAMTLVSGLKDALPDPDYKWSKYFTVDDPQTYLSTPTSSKAPKCNALN